MKWYPLKFLTFLIYMLFMQQAAAQKLELQNSGKIKDKAFEAYSAKNFDKAIELFASVYEGDTNYVQLHVLAARVCFEQKRYDSSRVYSLIAMQSPSSQLNEIYTILALSYHHLKMPDSADFYLDAGLERFPLDALLQYNKGFVLYTRGEMEKAIPYIRKSISINPWLASPHYVLGHIAALQSRPTQAMLAWAYYIYISEGNAGSMRDLETLSDGTYKPDPAMIIRKAVGTNDFEDIDALIEARLALNASYKTGVKIKAASVSQFKLVLEKFAYSADSKDIYMQLYGQFYRDIKDQKLFEPFIRYLIFSVDIDENNAWVKKNQAKISKTTDALSANIARHIDRQKVVLEGKEKDLECWYSNRKIESLGEVAGGDANKRIGTWYYFFNNGSLSAKGNYNANHKRDGLWIYYNSLGFKQYEAYFKDGLLDGSYKQFGEEGQLLAAMNYTADEPQDTARYYFPCGGLRKIVKWEKGEQHGMERTYHANGQLESRGMYNMGKYVDSATTFYENGRPNMELFYVNGELDGGFREYFESGQLYGTGSYKAGKRFGEWTYYYRNGQIQRQGTYNQEGKAEGIWRYFEEDGRPDRVLNFKNDDLFGEQKFYGNSGLLIRTAQAIAGSKYIEETNHDSTGNVIAKFGNPKGNYKVSNKEERGFKRVEGQYKNGLMDGTWTWYYSNGMVESMSEYKEGTRDGQTKEYSPRGVLLEETQYKQGDKDGLERVYYKDGTLLRQGYYVADNGVGRWEYYHENGQLSEQSFFKEDTRDGPITLYAAIGGIKRKELYEQGYARTKTYYDRTALPHQRIVLPAGNGDIALNYASGKLRSYTAIRCDREQGEVVAYFQTGDTASVTNYVFGKKEGRYVQYNIKKQITISAFYKENELHGDYVSFYRDGKPEEVGKYDLGKKTGIWKRYHFNGKLAMEVNYGADGERAGWQKEFDLLGELIYEKLYEKGNPTAVRYLLPNGNYATAISLKQDSVSYTTYFKNGKVSARESYYYGAFDGERLFNNSDGSLLDRYEYLQGEKHGAFKIGYLGGQTKEEGLYKNNDLEGVIKEYFANGQLRLMETYHAGWLEGISELYDEKGVLLKRSFHWDGERFDDVKE